jgi:predicted PurR-regulated permease PerM
VLGRIDWQRAQAMAICTIALLVVLWVLGQVLGAMGHALLLFTLSAVVAFLIAPLVDLGTQRGAPRPLMIAITYLALVLLLVGGAVLLAAPLVTQVSQLAVALPQYTTMVNDALLGLDKSLVGTPFEGGLSTLRAQFLTEFGGIAGTFLTRFLGALTSVGGSVSDSILILIISIYMLAAAPRFDRAMRTLLPAPQLRAYLLMRESLIAILGGYLRSQIVLALILGVVVVAGLQALGMPYALLLGILATILGLIPMFGSALSALPALAVALFQPFPTVVWVLIFFVVVQNLQDQVLAPRITGNAVGLHPLAVMFALVAGFELAGFVGALFGLPVAGLLWAIVVAVYRAVASPATTPLQATDLPRPPSHETDPGTQALPAQPPPPAP